MEKPTLDTVVQVLDALFNSQETMKNHEASEWLTQLQTSVFAWEIADQLLLLDRDMASTHFAAQTMQAKVRYSFSELPSSSHVALRDSLLNHLTNRSATSSPVTRQLALALVDLALQMDGWDTMVTDVINRFGRSDSSIPVLLDIITVLPEETSCRILRLGANKRNELRDMLERDCTKVLEMLSACLVHWPDDLTIRTKVFTCLSSWIQMGKFPVEELSKSPLILYPFQTLQLLNCPCKLYEAATDCICAALYVCEDVPHFHTLAVVLKQQVMQLIPLYKAAVEIEDVERAHCLVRVFTEMTESYLYDTVHPSPTAVGDMSMFEIMIECSRHPEFEVVDITFNVWYRISELLYDNTDEELKKLFQPYVRSLISSLCHHCQLDEDLPPKRVPAEKSDHSDFRRNVVEVVRDTVFLVGALNCFQEMYATICQPGQTWNMVEACLFIMQAVAASIKAEESQVLPIAVPVLLSISPETHYAVRATTLKLVGELAEWISLHSDSLDLVLRFILEGFQVSELATFAANSIHSVCHKCKASMLPHFEWLLRIIKAADSFSVSNNSIIGLLAGAVEVLEKASPDQISLGIRQLCLPHAQALMEIVQSSDPVRYGTLNDPSVWVDRIASVYRACDYPVKADQEHPYQGLTVELWPYISATLTKFQADSKIIERSCRCVRFMLRCLRVQANCFLSELVGLIMEIYRAHKHSCFLYLGSVIVDEFGNFPEYQPGLVVMTQAFAEVAFPQLSGAMGLVQNPDTIDDMFRLCARMVQRCPMAFLASPVASPALHCALASTIHQHREAFSSVMKFLKDLMHCPRDSQAREEETVARKRLVDEIVSHNGPILVTNLLNGFVSLPNYMLPESTGTLWEMLQAYKDLTVVWLQAALQNLKEKKATPDQQLQFLDGVQRSRDSDMLLSVVKNFAQLFR